MFTSLAVLALSAMAAGDPVPPVPARGQVVITGNSITADPQKQVVVVRGTEASPAVIRMGSGAGAVTVTASQLVYSESTGAVTAIGRGTLTLSDLR